MNERPSIPADLKRSVLVESGHRCAIPTCKNPDIDIHHIIPFEKCKGHSFENLVSLCPNCHRRAHNGEIDAKSLLLYKARLVKLDGIAAKDGKEIFPDQSEWETLKIDVEEKLGIKFSVQVDYPQFLSNTTDLQNLNAILRGDAISALVAERTSAQEIEAKEDEWWADHGNAYASSFSISLFTESLVSIRTTVYSYGAGAAHGNHHTHGQNFQLDPLRKLSLFSLLQDPDAALLQISKFCTTYLENENGSGQFEGWVSEGTKPEWENFEYFYLTNEAIVICFPPYQVGSFADGEREVVLSQRFLTPLLKDDSPLLKLWGVDKRT
jgi:Protein of unknown function (DUF3298)/HNH endonuclease/Deacetylase PdaC